MPVLVNARLAGGEHQYTDAPYRSGKYIANRILLDELPLKSDPSTVTVKRSSDNVVFTEIASGDPAQGQYRVVYDEGVELGGSIILNSLDNNVDFKVTFKARGHVLWAHVLNPALRAAGARHHYTGNLNMPNNTWVDLPASGEWHDIGNVHANGVHTVPSGYAGEWFFHAAVAFTPSVGEKNIRFVKNGSVVLAEDIFYHPTEANWLSTQVSCNADLNEGDNVKAQVRQISGATQDPGLGPGFSHINWMSSSYRGPRA